MKFAVLSAVVCVLCCTTLLSVTCAAPAATNKGSETDGNDANVPKTPEVEAAAVAVKMAVADADPAAAEAAGAPRNQNARASPVVDYVDFMFSKVLRYCVSNAMFSIGSSFGTIDSCAQACMVRGDCASFVYYAASQSCDLKYAVSGYAWARNKYSNADCTTYYKRNSLQVSSTGVADGRAYYQYMGLSAIYDNAVSHCRSRGLHLADIRTLTERNAATYYIGGSFWMNLYPAYSSNATLFRYRDDSYTMNSFVANFASNGLYPSVYSTSTAFCAMYYSSSYYMTPSCMSSYYVVCQYSDLDRY